MAEERSEHGEDSEEDTHTTNRRRLLGVLGAAGMAGLAGCGSSGGSGGGGGGGGGGGLVGTGGGSGGGGGGSGGTTPGPTDVTARSLSLPSGSCEQPARSMERTLEESRIGSDTTLGTDADVVIAQAGLQVQSGATLTVEPGTTVVFPQRTGLRVEGTLEASGSCSAPIALVGEQDRQGIWRGVTFGGNGAGTLDHVLVENGGPERGAGVTVGSEGLVELSNSQVRGSAGAGVATSRSGGSLAAFSGNALGENGGYGFIGGIRATSVLDEQTVYGDSASFSVDIAVRPSTVPDGETVTVPGIGLEPNFAVGPDGGGGITVAGTLEISAGARLNFGPEGHITVEGQGELVADAWNTDPIQLSGLNDTRGSWRGIRFRDARSTENRLRNVVVSEAGREDGQALLLDGESRVTVRGCEFYDSANYGLRLRQDATVENFRQNIFGGNGAPIWTSAQTAQQIGSMNAFDPNDDNRVHVYAGEFDGHVIPEGEEHTWSDPGVPFLLQRARGAAFAVKGSLGLGPGLTIQMAQDHGVYVTGELYSMVESEDLPEDFSMTEAPDDPPEAFVTVEGEQGTAGYWNSIAFDDTQSEDNSLMFTEVRHAGGGGAPAATEQQDAAVQLLRGSRLEFWFMTIGQSAGFGLFAQRNTDFSSPLNTVYFEEVQDPMYVYPNALDHIRPQLGFDQSRNEIHVKSPTGAVTESFALVDPGAPYRILPSQVDNTLALDTSVLVYSGVEFRFEPDLAVVVQRNGEFEVEGGSQEAVTNPDTILRGVQATPGYWQGIRYSETIEENNRITNTGIYHTGSAPHPDLVETEPKRAAVAATGAAETTVENCHIADYEGAAFAAAFTSNDLREDSVNSTINTSGNVVE